MRKNEENNNDPLKIQKCRLKLKPWGSEKLIKNNEGQMLMIMLSKFIAL